MPNLATLASTERDTYKIVSVVKQIVSYVLTGSYGTLTASSITTPLVIGGTTSSATLTLESTSGVGSSDYIAFETGSQAERLRIDNAGHIVVGGTSAQVILSDTPELQILGTTSDTARIGIGRWSNDASGPALLLSKNRSSAIGSNTIVSSGDICGQIRAGGHDGNAYQFTGLIAFEVDGSPSGGSMPGRITLQTTPSGSGSPVERLRIDNAGKIAVGDAASGAQSFAPSATKVYFSVNGTTDFATAIGVGNWGSNPAKLHLFRSNSGTVGSHTSGLVGSGSGCGEIWFSADDGATPQRIAMIAALTDATTGVNDTPGRLSFQTTPDGSTTPAERLRIDNAGNITHRTATAAFGYGAGAGGSVTQITNKSTGVTLSKPVGTIQTASASLASNTTVSFVLTNTVIASTDLLMLSHQAGGTAGSYTLNAQCATGSAAISIRNVSTVSLAEVLTLTYALMRGVVA